MREGRPRVVIIGGGFGGLYAAKALGNHAVDVTLIDRRNHHVFQPLLYQVATAGLNPADIAAPIRSIVRKLENVTVLLGEVSRIDTTFRRIVIDGNDLTYDYLIVATGAIDSYFGHNDWAAHAPGLKSLEDALEIRRRILFAYEAAEREPDPARRRAWLTSVVVGGGPTGVEMAGAMAEIAHHSLERDFRHIDPSEARVILIEGQTRVLPTFDASLAPKAQKQLERLRVDVMLDVRVTQIDKLGVVVLPNHGKNGLPAEPERIDARTVMWAAGVAASPLAKTLGVPLDRAGRVQVLPDLRIPGSGDVFVIGDLATLTVDGAQVPGVAPAAMQQGRHAAASILHLVAGEKTTPFHYLDKGMIATIGRSAAVGSIKGVKLSGFIAWFTWAFVHLLYLTGFRSRILVFVEWAWSYFTFQRGARLITGPIAPPDRTLPPPPPV